MKKLSDVTLEQLLILQHAKHDLRAAELTILNHVPNTPTEEVFNALIRLAQRYTTLDNDFNILSYTFVPSPCGCLGPQNDEPLCSCEMNTLMAEYKYDIAVQLKMLEMDKDY